MATYRTIELRVEEYSELGYTVGKYVSDVRANSDKVFNRIMELLPTYEEELQNNLVNLN